MTQQWRIAIVLCLGMTFFIYPRHALAANWQKMPNFSNTVVGAFTSSSNTLYAGIHQEVSQRLTENGLYRIEGDGTSVTKTYSNKDFGVQDIIFSNSKLYAAVPNNGQTLSWGIYRSDDNGVSFTKISQNLLRPHTLATNGTVFLAGAYGGLYKSTDGGVTWIQKIANYTTSDEFNHIVMQGNLAFAASPFGFYKSADAGESWQFIGGSTNTNRYLAMKDNIIFGGATSDGGVFRSEDSGATWQSFKGTFTISEYVTGPFVFGGDNDVYAGGFHVTNNVGTGTMFVSHDLGKTWQKIDSGITHDLPITELVTAVQFLDNKAYAAVMQDGIFMLDVAPPPKPDHLPVIFIPGIGGSEFKASEAFSTTFHPCDNPNNEETFNYSKDETIWVNEAKAALLACDDYFDVLKLDADGATPLYPKVTLKGTVYDRAYGKTIEFFTSNGYTEGKDFFFFPYDWRKDIRSTTPLLDAKVNEILASSGASKVQIVAHSMGGLVAREYIRDSARASKVDTLVELGVPHLGAPDALASLLYGKCFGKEKFGLCAGISATEIVDVYKNLSGGYDLLPSRQFFDKSVLKPFRDDRDVDNNGVTGDLDYGQTNQLLQNMGKNSDAIQKGDQLHNTLDESYNQTNVNTYQIVGSSHPTIGQIREYSKLSLGLIKTNKKDITNLNGDGTVTLLSAKLNQSDGTFYSSADHGSLSTDQSVLEMCLNLLKSNTDLVSGIQNIPFAYNGKLISTHSPVELQVYDNLGNHTGQLSDGTIQENIPGSSYEKLGDTTFIYLPQGGDYRTETKATAAESFDLKVKDYQNDTLSSETLFFDIPQTLRTQTTLDLEATNPALVIDQNGDGTTDTIRPPTSIVLGGATADTAAPTSTASVIGTAGQNSWYVDNPTVTLVAQDEASGSGILRTEYSLDNWQTVVPYSQPVTITSEGGVSMVYRSVDNVGNEEQLKSLQLKIDKTPPVITPISRTPSNSNGWNNTDVMLTWSCVDNLSEPLVPNVSQTVTDEGERQSAVGTCTDKAGNSSIDVQNDIKIDKTAPTVSINGVENGATYTLGSVPNASCDTSDQLSGVIANATISISGNTTNGVGNIIATCSGGADEAGNKSQPVSVAYQVQYKFTGFFDPVDNPPMLNLANAGRTIPLKWNLGGISALSSLNSIKWAAVSCRTLTGETNGIDATTNGGTTLRYDTVSSQFIDNLTTKSAWAGTCQRLALTLDDNTSHTVNFKFK